MTRFFLCLLIPLAFYGCGQHPSTERPPNIILIMADDIGIEGFGCYGSTHYQTPHIDRLASQGLRFTHCHSQPLCTPSRVQLMTGRYNHRNYEGFGYLKDSEITFANCLKQKGYATCIAGKWQLNGLREKKSGHDDALRPRHFGFDTHCLWQLTRKRAGANGSERYSQALIDTNGTLTTVNYGPDAFTDFILTFMTRNKDKPFLVYYPMVLTHCPFWPTPDSPEWNNPDKRRPGHPYVGEPRFFEGQVAYMDKLVGRIVDRVDELGLSDNTLILFTGDNGTDTPITSPFLGGHIKGGKGLTQDSGTHVPLIARWSKTISPGKAEDLVDFSDFLPTLCDVAGAEIPADRVIDGHSLKPRITGQAAHSRDWIYCHYWNKGLNREKAKTFVRNHHYKLYATGEMYDVVHDPEEKSPLTSLNLEEVKIKNQFLNALQSVNAD